MALINQNPIASANPIAPATATVLSPQPNGGAVGNNLEHLADTDEEMFSLDKLPERRKEVNAYLSAKEHNLVKFMAAYSRQTLTHYAATALIETAKRDFARINGRRGNAQNEDIR